MKQFGQLLLAAVLGSICTISAYQWWGKENQGVRIEHISGVPTSTVGYSLNENGQPVNLDFTVIAEKVTKAVVYIRSLSSDNGMIKESNDPLQYFFARA